MKQLLNEFRMLRCMACGAFPPNDVHHIKTRGSGGSNEAHNLIPLCRYCHTAWHTMGAKSFIKKHPHIMEYLTKLGWEILNGKLWNQKETTQI